MKDIKKFTNILNLEDALINDITQSLKENINKSGHATLLLSGGSTPIELYKKLSNADLNWQKITIGLVDERYVPVNDEHSNEKMIRDTLLQNRATKANFTGMVIYSNNLSLNLETVSKNYAEHFKEITYCLLGMGTDGHTASLFPNDKKSEASLNKEDLSILVSTNSPNFPNRRISCGCHFLKKSKKISLMMLGEGKLKVLNNSKINKLPISKFLDIVDIYYTD